MFPRGRDSSDEHRPLIVELNATLAQKLVDRPRTTFLDIGPRFLKADGTIAREIMPDSLHPSDRGYAIWGDAVVKSGLLP